MNIGDSFELDPDILKHARRLSVDRDISTLKAIQELLGISNEGLMAILSRTFNYPCLFMDDMHSLSPNFKYISYTDCVQRGVLVCSDQNKKEILVLSDPFDGGMEDWALHQCRKFSLYPVVALLHPDDLEAYFFQQERQLSAMDGFDSASVTQDDAEVVAVITLEAISQEENKVVKLVNSTIYDALKLQASDIHLECDVGMLHVLYRIDGALVQITQVQGKMDGAGMAEQVISRIKVMAELDIAERRIPQDGRFKVRVNQRDVDFRVSIMPNIFGEDAVLRLLDRQSLTEETKALSLNNLGLDSETISQIRKLAKKPHGMLLVTGPTGSGKTTTLYAAITEIHTGRDKIVTIEDPVEYRLPRVLQIPVNEKKGLTFARGLRSILRHDPDKIMIGEIRDGETAQIAVQAALTGHLVFTTLHANSVFDVLGRFLHMGVDAYSFSAALNGIVAQRLFRINCPHCSVKTVPDDEYLESANLSKDKTKNWEFKAGQGCSHCRGVGYRGRKAVAEVLILDDSMREMIATKAPISQLKARAMQAGLLSLQETAWQCVSRGETTIEEVLRVAG